MASYKYTSITDCEICKEFSDHESYDDLFYHVGNSPEFNNIRELLGKLVSIPKHKAHNYFTRCPLCGTFYYYNEYTGAGDHETLELDRVPADLTESFRLLLESTDETILSKVLGELLSYDNEQIRRMVKWSALSDFLEPRMKIPIIIRLLEKLLSNPSLEVKNFASDKLRSIS